MERYGFGRFLAAVIFLIGLAGILASVWAGAVLLKAANHWTAILPVVPFGVGAVVTMVLALIAMAQFDAAENSHAILDELKAIRRQGGSDTGKRTIV